MRLSRRLMGLITVLLLFATMHSVCENVDGKRVLRVGGDYAYPPSEYITPEGRVTGFNVELIMALAKEKGFSVAIELAPWNEVRKKLELGQLDIVLGMYYSEARDEKVDFSVAHTYVGHRIFVRAESEIDHISELKGRTVIVQKDDIMNDYLQKQKMTSDIILVETISDALDKLYSGGGDVALLSALHARPIALERYGDEIEARGAEMEFRKYCFAVQEGDIETLSMLNEGLLLLKRKGIYQQLYEKWYGVYEANAYFERLKIYMLSFVILLLLSLIAIGYTRWLVKRKTHLLDESRIQLELALEVSHLGIWIWNIKANSIKVNEQWLRLYNYPLNYNLIGFNQWKENVYPDDWPGLKDRVEAFKSGKVSNYFAEYRVKTIGLGWRWHRAQGKIAKVDGEGRPILAIGTQQDIHQERQKEVEIIKAHQQLLSIFNGMDEVVYIADKKSYEILYVNDAGRKLWGDVVGRLCYKVVFDQGEECIDCIDQIYERINNGESYIFEAYNAQRGVWFKRIAKLLLWPDGRKVLYEMLIDITAQKEAEAALQVTERNYHQLVETSLVGIFKAESNGKPFFINQALAEFNGFTIEEMCSGIHNFVTCHDEVDWERMMMQLVEKQVLSQYELEVINRKEELKDVLVNLNLEKGIISGVVMDVSRLKGAEKELKKYRLHLEQLVKERTLELENKNSELERMNKLFVGREFRIKELKDKLQDIREIEEKQRI